MLPRWVTFAYLVYLVAPIALLVVGSFGGLWLNTLLPTGLTGRWYAEVAADASFRRAFTASLIVAGATAAACVLAGLPLAYAVYRTRRPALRAIARALYLLPIALPPLVLAFGFMLVFSTDTLPWLGSFWLLEVMRRSSNDFIPNPQRSEPDFYVEKFSYVKISKTGNARYHFSGAKLTHNPLDDSYDIVLPVISSLGDAQSPMMLRAERARVNSDNSQVHLYHDVHMDRPASPANERMHVKSEYLLLLPDDEIVKTDEPAEITVGQSKLSNGIVNEAFLLVAKLWLQDRRGRRLRRRHSG